MMLAQKWGPTKNLAELLISYTTLSFERAAEADLQTRQQRSFSHAKPMRQRHSLF
jgi:hypothetical protein